MDIRKRKFLKYDLKSYFKSGNLLKRIIKSISARLFFLYYEVFLYPIRKYFYYKQINQIKQQKEMVLFLEFGGLGDCLIWTEAPEILKKKYDIDFYIDERCKNVFRHPDIFKLCFDINPYFKGFKKTNKPFRMEIFGIDKIENYIYKIANEFGYQSKGVPKIYYKPNFLKDYKNVLLLDTNTVTGSKTGAVYNDSTINKLCNFIQQNENLVIEKVDVKKQDIFRYIDMVYSSKYFICLFSGSSNLAACVREKNTFVFLPQNVYGPVIYGFTYFHTHIKYFRFKEDLDKYIMGKS